MPGTPNPKPCQGKLWVSSSRMLRRKLSCAGVGDAAVSGPVVYSSISGHTGNHVVESDFSRQDPIMYSSRGSMHQGAYASRGLDN